LFASSVFFGGVAGDVLGGIVTDQMLRRGASIQRARRDVVLVGLVGAILALLPMMFVHDLLLCTIFLVAGLFFCEFTIGPMWALPMDIAPDFSGTATGLMCVGGSFAAFLSPIVTGFLVDQTGTYRAGFLCTILLLAVGTVLAFRMRPERTFGLAGHEMTAETPLALTPLESS
jgi:MFS-type transporter involved in bile tolerance (Atg22 family)